MALIVDLECPKHGNVAVVYERRHICPKCSEESEQGRLAEAWKRVGTYAPEEIQAMEIDVLREMLVKTTSEQANYWEKVANKLEESRLRQARLWGFNAPKKP